MPIDPGKVPAEAVAAFQAAMNERAARSAFSTPNLQRADMGSLARSTPHRVAYLPLAEIRRGNDLRKATKPGGWRFLIHGPGEAIAAARVVARDAGSYELAELSEGPLVSGTENTIQVAEDSAEVRNGRFEAVLLMAPEVQVIALWLKDLHGNADRVLMIPPSGTPPGSYQPMTPAAFLDVLHGLAETVRRTSVARGRRRGIMARR